MPNIANNNLRSINSGVSPLKPNNNMPKYTPGVSKGKGISNMSKGLKAGLGIAGSALGAASSGGLTAEQGTLREGIRQGISSLGPVGAIVGAASGIVDAVGSATGLNLDNLDSGAASRAGISGSAGFNNFVNSLPGVSMLVGMFGGRTTKSYKSDITTSLADAFGKTNNDIDAAQKLGGQRMLFGKGKANRFIRAQNVKNQTMTGIGIMNNLSSQNSLGETYAINDQNRFAGYSPQLTLAAKHGIKIPELEITRALIKSWKTPKIEEPQKFQLGGKMNLIPEGELHARKHDIETTNPELEGNITKKGIPVIMQSEDGEITQTAEIEKNEWTLRKEFTDKLEELYKEYKKDKSDEIAIETGKLICYELLKNTDDRSGLIKSIK